MASLGATPSGTEVQLSSGDGVRMHPSSCAHFSGLCCHPEDKVQTSEYGSQILADLTTAHACFSGFPFPPFLPSFHLYTLELQSSLKLLP